MFLDFKRFKPQPRLTMRREIILKIPVKHHTREMKMSKLKVVITRSVEVGELVSKLADSWNDVYNANIDFKYENDDEKIIGDKFKDLMDELKAICLE